MEFTLNSPYVILEHVPKCSDHQDRAPLLRQALLKQGYVDPRFTSLPHIFQRESPGTDRPPTEYPFLKCKRIASL